jgi:hypothetical protein
MGAGRGGGDARQTDEQDRWGCDSIKNYFSSAEARPQSFESLLFRIAKLDERLAPRGLPQNGGDGQRSRNTGLRFSRKAVIPSAASAV